MRLHTTALSGVTLVQNTFIDYYMLQANGEYVKVYLYLLRCAEENMDLTLSSAADALEYTEKDLLRALSYWEKVNLLQIDRASDGTIQDIIFNETSVPAVSAAPAAPKSDPPEKETADSLPPAPSRERADTLMENPDIKQLIFVAEQYLQRTLYSSEQDDLLYYYDSLHFSVDLIEYLLEYCISKGSFSRYYMNKVAIAWAKAGITTVSQAREETNLYNRNYFSIMNAFGLRNRNPGDAELEFMSNWINELGFSLDIILEACRRALLHTHEPNFQYADSILKDWNKQGVRSISDIPALDQKYQEKQKNLQQTPGKNSSNRFNNFSQREYDYSQLERQLLNS